MKTLVLLALVAFLSTLQCRQRQLFKFTTLTKNGKEFMVAQPDQPRKLHKTNTLRFTQQFSSSRKSQTRKASASRSHIINRKLARRASRAKRSLRDRLRRLQNEDEGEDTGIKPYLAGAIPGALVGGVAGYAIGSKRERGLIQERSMLAQEDIQWQMRADTSKSVNEMLNQARDLISAIPGKVETSRNAVESGISSIQSEINNSD